MRGELCGTMSQIKTSTIATLSGSASVVIGLAAFGLNWSLWDLWGGPMPGIQVLLFPGNLTLTYIWHPLFTEEVNFWQKLALQMLGQFVVVTCVAAALVRTARRWSGV